jgi:methylmalonyl-CoA/ethylmalonyl-CoA epimerase
MLQLWYPDIEAALGFWRDALGLDLHHVEDVPSQKAMVAFLPTGESEVELVQPTAEDTGAAKFLNERGPGMHHLCFEVDDLDGMMTNLREKGVRLINETPVELEGRRLIFIHPKSANGVLVELYELTRLLP